jgi:YD repeat-containing protein
MKNGKKFFGMLGALVCALGLHAMEFKSTTGAVAELEYFYAKDGMITERRVNASIQMYSYDKRGQLLAVVDSGGTPVEQYAYDPAGNILRKTVNGKTTTFTYDKANQLVSSTMDGTTTTYRYDGAGRLVKEGDKTYEYGYLDKILNALENGETIAGFDYHIGGQIASSTTKDGTENFLWDGLALIHRAGTDFINEPAITGGNPVLAGDNVMFNDMLGSTLGVKSGEGFNQIAMTAFGNTENLASTTRLNLVLEQNRAMAEAVGRHQVIV